jgi:hypothetical protein
LYHFEIHLTVELIQNQEMFPKNSPIIELQTTLC